MTNHSSSAGHQSKLQYFCKQKQQHYNIISTANQHYH